MRARGPGDLGPPWPIRFRSPEEKAAHQAAMEAATARYLADVERERQERAALRGR